MLHRLDISNKKSGLHEFIQTSTTISSMQERLQCCTQLEIRHDMKGLVGYLCEEFTNIRQSTQEPNELIGTLRMCMSMCYMILTFLDQHCVSGRMRDPLGEHTGSCLGRCRIYRANETIDTVIVV
jgi:hypothetical protein